MRIVLLLMLVLAITKVYADEPHLRISTVENVAAYPEVVNMLSRAYAELGYHIELVPMPAKRSLRQAKENIDIDAELARTEYAAPFLPNHLRIPIPIAYITIAAFVMRDDLEIVNWQSLQAYGVGGVRGHLFIESKLKNHNKLLFLSSANQALTMLSRGRLDVVILPQTMGEYVVKQNWHSQVKMVSPALDYVPLYHYLHQKHHAIAGNLTQALSKQVDAHLVKNQAY
ncbi:substrate-binding periplasmic protein [Agarivorans sp. MS3-6]